ncbi:uncharacterized protein [Amphiura filiformis]|uniref:uncharacterized protein n=1 Tax=Amphiura filiformis TaxID=82378 RepID=UPI003B21316F
MKDKQPKAREKKKDDTPSKCMVAIPYVEGLAERLQRIFKKHNISTAMRNNQHAKSLLVHPKDTKDIEQTSDVVCKGCDKSNVGETGRQFGTRLKEYKKDSETIAERKFTRANRKESTSEQHKSAITDHIAQENHVIEWEGAKILDRDSNAFTRRIREAIQIRKKGAKAINRDEGIVSLDHVYDQQKHHHFRQNFNKPGKAVDL